MKSYTEAVGLLTEFLAARAHPLTVNAVKRGDIRDFIADQLQRWKPTTALNRYRSLQAFFKWCVAEGELERSPMVGMKPPQLPDEPPPVLTDDQLRRPLKSCDGRDFADRRDTAIIRLSSTPVFASPRRPASCSPTIWTWTTRSSSCLARIAANAPCRLVARPPWQWIGTFACAPATSSHIFRTCVSVPAAP